MTLDATDRLDILDLVRSYLMLVQPGEPLRPVTIASITHHTEHVDGRWLITRRIVTTLNTDAAAP